MSNDQLGWDQLLNSNEKIASEKSAETATSETPSRDDVVAPTASTEPESASASPRARKKKASATTAAQATAGEDLFAKKDWSKLEVDTPTKQITVETEKVVRLKVEPLAKKTAPPPASTVREGTEPEVLSVTELNRAIRDRLEGGFPLIWLKAEISNFKAHTSGHFYFSLKDAKAQISAVMFRGYNSQLRFAPEDGMEVLVRGKITVYEPRGNYQIFCELMEPVGAGALQKAFEQLKAKLAKEGLFDEARKRPLPALPKHIAIVTSPTGAAIRDMLNVLGRRFKGARITVIPCKVQGREAATEIVNAIELANRLPDVDVMIVGRGGGSIEDMWCFNEEKVARAIAAARVPVISAVGHEIDFTIADFVADLRAPTPSAAAELVVKNAADLADRVQRHQRALKMAALQLLASLKQTTQAFSKRLVDPQRKIQDATLRCDELIQRLRLGIKNRLQRNQDLLQKHMAVLDSLSPLKVLDRGYSMVVQDGKIVTSANALKTGDHVSIRMCKGSIEAEVLTVDEKKR